MSTDPHPTSAAPGPLAGRGALVIGGGGGFGRAIAAALAADGAAVTIMGRTEATLRAAAGTIAAATPGGLPVRISAGDSTREKDVAAAVRAADETPLAAVVTTVGGGTFRPLLALDAETLEHDFRRNVTTALHAIRYGGQALAARGGGAIVCTSSSAGGHSFPFMPSYSVSKAALEALVRVAADVLGHLAVRVNVVRPGIVATDGENPGRLLADPELAAATVAEKPLSRIGRAEDVAAAVRFLCGPGSSWITGACLPVEGGAHLRRAPRLEKLARIVNGDEVVDATLAGRIP